jgi:hypothetical protein
MGSPARIRPFQVRFDIAKSTFSDYESFVRSFARNARLQIREFHEAGYCYVFDNEWMVALNRDSRIELCSPILDSRNAEEVNRVVDALQIMNVRVGENCRAQIQYQRLLDTLGISRLVERVPIEFWCGFWLVVFLVLKTAEFQIQDTITTENAILLQSIGYLIVAFFSVCFYKATFQERSPSPRPVIVAKEPDQSDKASASSGPVPAPSVDSPPNFSTQWQELVREIRIPLDNVMAYTRFYQGAIQSDSQHAKDLTELMEQAIRIEEILNRLEPMTDQEPKVVDPTPSRTYRDLFRRTPRALELIPMIVQGQDPLGEEFESPSYTLNTSSHGACLLLPDRVVKPGQHIILKNHQLSTEAEVRWVIEGKAGQMVFAGVQFPALASSSDAAANPA